MTVLELSTVSKRYGEELAVDNVSFQVEEGRIVSLLGPSGCGKTTTLRLIAGFEVPDGGDIRIRGECVSTKRPYERNVGLVFQDFALFPHMSVEANIAFGLRERGVPASKFPERIRSVLDLVKMRGYEKRSPQQLSGGQQQRVALARALVTQPSLLLLDEPLSSLDAKLREALRVELRQILTSAGTTTIIVTHDQSEAMSLADHIIVMSKGRIMQRGSAEEIYSAPANKFVADFVGQSNWFTGRLDGGRFVTEDGLSIAVAAKAPGGAVELGIRPERIAVRTKGAIAAVGVNALEGVIEKTEYLGSTIHHWVRLANGRRIHAVVQNNGQCFARDGESVQAEIRPEDCLVLAPEA
ncbi:ATP-binding cassette domain-containing protein [Bradyrhizobium sp. CSA112]|uniref:ABC transporter ATP-binding protein n=1 Tax=Bradyrhizobium sp. CSA112 TaxID=2699170 RepID=UPI0023AF95CF|nr:ABC transporter ATP-binding protein [Bradyrhizobium sp. CSA112]MDE5458940.1 ATP-binding cassette domain-containing protein [Bradyrhizobium sp. CSA112]